MYLQYNPLTEFINNEDEPELDLDSNADEDEEDDEDIDPQQKPIILQVQL
jgi:hypothetical protein